MDRFDKIKWINPPDMELLRTLRDKIVEDIVKGNNNLIQSN
jgi:hypothetical protein